jgi:WD40 repeat protein/serine/threonine protein kinase/tetratricopeptide (TPR) repeat protein
LDERWMDAARLDLATDPGRFVRDALAWLEGDLRELALVALADWEACGILSTELFRPIAALQRPSWGHWNGLLTALREVRRAVLRGAAEADRDRVRRAHMLSAVVELLDREAEPTTGDALRPLANLTHISLARRPRVGALLALPIALRNLVVHFAPTEAEWWAQAAAALEPLALLRERGELRPAGDFPDARHAPWFVEIDGAVYSFNGLRGDTVLYAAPGASPREAPEQYSAVLASFRRLLGKADEQEGNLRRLLAKLVPEDLKGVLLGDYLVGRPVGSGGYATVHVATQLSTGRKVAVKLLRDGLSDDARVRFRQEAAFLSRLAHPNIVGILGYGEEAWAAPRDPAVAEGLASEAWFQELARSAPIKSYLAMEWIEGHTLEEIFQGKHSRPEIRGLAGWMEQASLALSAVHNAGLIHRDVKPGNLMVTDAGVLKLMDFGVARRREAGRSLVTTPGRVLGTPAYMAPEQLEARGGDDEVGPASDIYGLCATFYELFTGARLFQHDRETEKAVETRKLAGERPERPRRLAGGLPWEVETILLGGLEPGLVERYRSAADLARDVRHYLRDEPIEYRQPGALRRSRLFYRRHRALVNLSAAALLMAMVGLTVYIVSIRQERARTAEQRTTAEQRLVRSYLREGIRQLEAANPLASLPFFTAAYSRAAEAKLVRDDAHQLRLGAMFSGAPRRIRCLPHIHNPSHLAISPDGRFLVTAAEYRSGSEPFPEQELGEVSVWDTGTGDQLAGPLRLDDPVTVLAFSPGCDRLAVGTGNSTGRQGAGEAMVLTLPRLELVCLPLRHPGPRKNDPMAQAGMQRGQGDWVRSGVGIITAVAFTPDGRRVVTCSDEGTARIWDARTGEPVDRPLRHGRGVSHGILTSDGAALITADEQSEVRVWDLKTGKPRFDPQKVKITGNVLAVHPAGSRLATASYSDGVVVWDLTTGTKVVAITGFGLAMVDSLAFSPGGDLLLVAERGAAATLWEITDRERLLHRLPHKDVRSAAFSTDGLTIVTVGDGVRFWGTKDGHESFPRLPDGAAVLHPDGHRAFTARDSAAWLWQLPLLDACPVLPPDGGKPSSASVELASDCRTALFTFLDSDVRRGAVHCSLIETASGLPLCPGWSHPADYEHPLATAIRPDGRLVATAGSDGRVEFRVAAPRITAPPALAHPGRVTLLAFRPDGAVLATAGEDKVVRLWDLANGQLVGAPLTCANPVRNLGFSPDGLLLAAASQGADATEIRVWNAATGKPICGPLAHPGENLGVWIWPAPVRVVAVGKTGVGIIVHRLYLWDLANGQPAHDPLEMASPEFDADGGRMLLGGRLFDTRTGSPAVESSERIAAWLPDAGLTATSVQITETEPGIRVRQKTGQAFGPAVPVPSNTGEPTFSPDGRLLAALAGKAELRIWETQTGDPVIFPIPVLEHSAPPRFTPDGHSVVLVCDNPYAEAWTLRVPVEPFAGSAQEAANLARLLAGLGLDDAGGLVRLDVRAEWERRNRTPDPGPSDSQLRAWHLARANECQSRNWAGTAFHLRRAAEHGADGPDVAASLGQAYLELGQYAGAREAFDRAVERGGTSWSLRAGRAEAFVGLKDWKRALADFDAAVAAGSTDHDVLLGRAAARAEAGNQDGASADIADVVHEYREMGDWLTSPVRDRLAAGDWRAVVAFLDYLEPRYRRNRFVLVTTNALSPAEMYASRGVARFALGELDGAVEDFNTADQTEGAGAGYRFAVNAATKRLAVAPGDARMLHLRGLARSRLGESDAAMADLRAALSADPAAFHVWWTIADVCKDRGDWPGVEQAFSAGIALAANPPSMAYHKRGWSRAEQRKWRAAAEDFSECIRRDPASSAAWAVLGLARLGGGDREGLHDVLARLRLKAEAKDDEGDASLQHWTLLSAVGDDRVDPAELDRAAERLGVRPDLPAFEREVVAAARCRCGRFEKAAEVLSPITEKDLTGAPLTCALRAACASARGKADEAKEWTARAAKAASEASWPDRTFYEAWQRQTPAAAAGTGVGNR